MNRIVNLLLVVGAVSFILWALGFFTSYTLGGYVHVMLVFALICIVVWIVLARRRS